MTWPIARFGSRFSLLMEPQQRRVMHSALGRFLDQPLDLAVGLVEPDGTERVLPFTATGEPLYACEQFERINSITYRGHSERYGLRFELNIHSPFYPQDEKLSLMPVFYVELRVMGAPRVRLRQFSEIPKSVRLFLKMGRPGTRIEVGPGRIDLSYGVSLEPRYEGACGRESVATADDRDPPSPAVMKPAAPPPAPPVARVLERIHSLNDGATPVTDAQGRSGLTLEIPVTDEGSGIKWRLVWCSYTSDPVLDVRGKAARLRYNHHWPSLEAVMTEAVATRDDNLALSRRFEKLMEQAPLSRARWHLLVLAFQSFLSNTFWCDVEGAGELFSIWDGNRMYQNTVDVGYNTALFAMAFWPRLMELRLDDWAKTARAHEGSGGLVLSHDSGRGIRIGAAQYPQPMPAEVSSDFLLLMQMHVHWTGDLGTARRNAAGIAGVARYLLWSDRQDSGFVTEGTATPFDDGPPALHAARKQTYLAIKRVMALDAAADLLQRTGDRATADRCRSAAATSVPRIEADAWLGDHYAVCLDHVTESLLDADTGQALSTDRLSGWDDYSIHTGNGLLLPMLIAQPVPFDRDKLRLDLANAQRETLRNYGCVHTSSDHTNIWISQNLWRDFTSRYLLSDLLDLNHRYWDLLVFSNTAGQSFGYIDTYVGNEAAFNPRGVTSIGYFLAGPRLVIDRLDTEYIAVDPDRGAPARWPLLALADWEAGRVPVCVVHDTGAVTIEGEISPVKIVDRTPRDADMIG